MAARTQRRYEFLRGSEPTRSVSVAQDCTTPIHVALRSQGMTVTTTRHRTGAYFAANDGQHENHRASVATDEALTETRFWGDPTAPRPAHGRCLRSGVVTATSPTRF